MTDTSDAPEERTVVTACPGVLRGIGVLLTHEGALVAAGPLINLPAATGLVCLVSPEDYELIARYFNSQVPPNTTVN